MSPSRPARRWSLRVIPYVAAVSVGYVLFAPAAVPEQVIRRLGIDYATFGLLTTVPLLAVVLAQAPSSYLTGRHATTRLFAGAIAAHATLAVALDVAATFEALLLLRFLWGGAGGVLLTVSATHIARTGAADQTLRQGLYGGMLTLGGAVAFLVGPPVLAHPGPVGLYSVGAASSLPALALSWRFRSDESTRPTGRGDRGRAAGLDARVRRTAARVAGQPVVAVAALCYVATLGSYITLSTFVTSYFDDLGVSVPLNVFVLVVATAGRAGGGVAATRWLDRRLVVGATASAATGFVALAGLRMQAVVVSFPILAMFAVSFPFGAIYSLAGRADVEEGTALAIVIGAGNAAALVIPTAVGAARDLFDGYQAGFGLLAALNVAATVAVLALSATDGPAE